jgi:ketosteroid isomerase-like protein
MIIRRILVLLSFFILLSVASANDELRTVAERNLVSLNNEDFQAHAQTLHPDSLNYQPTLDMVEQLFDIYDLQYRLVDFSFVAEDYMYAYARVVAETRKISGPAFNNNRMESLWVFRQHNGEWKIWSNAILDIAWQ